MNDDQLFRQYQAMLWKQDECTKIASLVGHALGILEATTPNGSSEAITLLSRALHILAPLDEPETE